MTLESLHARAPSIAVAALLGAPFLGLLMAAIVLAGVEVRPGAVWPLVVAAGLSTVAMLAAMARLRFARWIAPGALLACLVFNAVYAHPPAPRTYRTGGRVVAVDEGYRPDLYAYEHSQGSGIPLIFLALGAALVLLRRDAFSAPLRWRDLPGRLTAGFRFMLRASPGAAGRALAGLCMLAGSFFGIGLAMNGSTAGAKGTLGVMVAGLVALGSSVSFPEEEGGEATSST